MYTKGSVLPGRSPRCNAAAPLKRSTNASRRFALARSPRCNAAAPLKLDFGDIIELFRIGVLRGVMPRLR